MGTRKADTPDGFGQYRNPGATNRDIAFARLPEDPESLLHDELYPDDAYKGTTYWADLPAGERTKFVNQQANAETARELRLVLDMAKNDPLSPIKAYFNNFVITGVGFFSEGYVLFSGESRVGRSPFSRSDGVQHRRSLLSQSQSDGPGLQFRPPRRP